MSLSVLMNPSALSLLTGPLKGTEVATVVEIFILLTLLSVAPLVLVTLTSFTRIVVVLSFLRQALGTQQSPSNQIIIALSLFLSFHVMAPVWQRIEADAVTPYFNRQVGPAGGSGSSLGSTCGSFFLDKRRKADLALFMRHESDKEVDLSVSRQPVLIPAFVISELKTAFQMAFLIYVPFLVLDLVVASILMSMGMMFLPPVLISLPFKLVLFVLVDGWNLLVGSLDQEFRMTPESLIDILRGALQVGGTVAGPTILFGLIAGVAVSIFQATTQINDFTLVFVPKVLATLLALILFGSWMLQMYISFTRQIIISLPTMIN